MLEEFHKIKYKITCTLQIGFLSGLCWNVNKMLRLTNTKEKNDIISVNNLEQDRYFEANTHPVCFLYDATDSNEY